MNDITFIELQYLNCRLCSQWPLVAGGLAAGWDHEGGFGRGRAMRE